MWVGMCVGGLVCVWVYLVSFSSHTFSSHTYKANKIHVGTMDGLFANIIVI